ncbi:hypothetical protein LOC68_11090 [Blastopirellula sp. JC732]|uniref:Uncharacterized protein n=1 Tax=Blastopirellula sediminis TaxID=2894196 RepID=A0A9X1MLQ8_9BACT|nr:hypothetical protein [Blastopirellula sediminis]MCC9608273.1 hypothetical protein [Blastopirellula sediminis]MCC9628944.1 hypothetical protein [Blastopirellula sediminis]
MGQDRNSGNKGDQLKHCLLAETLGNCGDWSNITYAETHAGAGVYSQTKQEEEGATHIADLRADILSVGKLDPSSAGSRYTNLLEDWWQAESNQKLYPGSVCQALLQTASMNENCGIEEVQVRVTEACPHTHERLTEALAPFGYQARHDAFQHNLDWLTENDDLFLLIDPFTYTTNRDALDIGHIDLETLSKFVSACLNKSRCIVGFWCAMGRKQPEGKTLQTQFNSELRQLAERQDALFRYFSYGQYSIAWIGIAGGRPAIEQIPRKANWKRTWLEKVIKESE